MFPGLRNAFGSSIHPKYSSEHSTHELLCAGLSSELPCPVSLQKLCGVHLGHIPLDIAPSLELPCSVRKQKFSGEHLGQTSGPPDFGHSGHLSLFSFSNSLFFLAILSCLSISSSFNLSTSASCFNNSSSSFISFKFCSSERILLDISFSSLLRVELSFTLRAKVESPCREARGIPLPLRQQSKHCVKFNGRLEMSTPQLLHSRPYSCSALLTLSH